MQKELSIQEQVKQLGILYLALIAGQIGMFIVLFFVIENNPTETTDGALGGGFMPLIISLFSVMSIAMAFLIYNKRKENGRQLEGGLHDKLAHFRTSFMVRAAVIEGVNFLALIVYFFIDDNYLYLVIFAIGISAFFLIRPTIDRLIEDYQLSANEQSELRNSLK